MSLSISVSSNVKQFQRRLSRVQRKQLPFATMKAINDTAFDVKDRTIQRTFPAAFPEGKNRSFIKQALRIRKARKTNLEAHVFDRFGYEWLQRQAKGGTKRPKRKALAIPQFGKRGGLKRTARGVSPAKRPKALRGRPNIITPRQGSRLSPGIYKRVGGARNRRLVLLYRFVSRSVRVKKAFRFYEDAQRETRKKFPIHFRRHLRRALKTAR